MFRILTHYATFFVENWCCGIQYILVQYYYTWMDSKLNEYYDDRKRESHRVRKRYFRSHPHLIISPKPRRKRLGRRKWPTQLLLLLCLRVCVEHSLLLELAKYAIFSKTKPQNKILTNKAEGIANTTTQCSTTSRCGVHFLCF